MPTDINLLARLLKPLSTLLKTQGLRRETDEWDMAIFARKRGKDIQRLGFVIEKSRNKKGEFEFAVLVGLSWSKTEFHLNDSISGNRRNLLVQKVLRSTNPWFGLRPPRGAVQLFG